MCLCCVPKIPMQFVNIATFEQKHYILLSIKFLSYWSFII